MSRLRMAFHGSATFQRNKRLKKSVDIALARLDVLVAGLFKLIDSLALLRNQVLQGVELLVGDRRRALRQSGARNASRGQRQYNS